MEYDDDDEMEGVPPLSGFKDSSLPRDGALARHASHLTGQNGQTSPRQSFLADGGRGYPERSSTSLPSGAGISGSRWV